MMVLGIACSVMSVRDGRFSYLVPGIALIMWGYTLSTGPAPLDRMRVVDYLAPIAVIPLAPFYINLVAESMWGEAWAETSLLGRVLLFLAASSASLVIVIAVIRLKKSEVFYYRRRQLGPAIYEALSKTSGTSDINDRWDRLEDAWARVPLDLGRCELLIAADIPPESATSAEVQALSDEHLASMAYLSRKPPTDTQFDMSYSGISVIFK